MAYRVVPEVRVRVEEAQALYEVWEEELSDTLKEATARIKSKELDK